MKHHSLYTILAALLLLTGCGDFFEESSQDEIKPSTTEDLAAVLYAEAYPYATYVNDAYLILLTDETECRKVNNERLYGTLQAGQPVFCFSKGMFDGIEPFNDDENSWKKYYNLIKGCNVVLDYADNMAGSQKDRTELKGQARALRAFYYQKLVGIYCQAYSAGNPDELMGVPLIVTSHVSDEHPSRASLRKTCDFIEKEYIQAIDELKDYKPTTIYRITPDAINALLTRLYVFEGAWDKLITVATELIKDGPQLTDFNQIRTGTKTNIYDVATSSEVLWNYAGAMYSSVYVLNGGYATSGQIQPYNVSPEAIALYQTGDLRYNTATNDYTYICRPSTEYIYAQKTAQNSRNGEHGIRMAEVYLNRAEAYARTGQPDKAMNDLNALRAKRFQTAVFNELEAADANEAIDNIIEERRREFIWEDGLRWIDIKRLGLSITHVYYDEQGNASTFTLESNSPLYALPIPQDAISKNVNLVQNPR